MKFYSEDSLVATESCNYLGCLACSHNRGEKSKAET